MDEGTRGYIAGFFDGEGSIMLIGGGGQLTVEIGNTNEEIIDWLCEKAGGRKLLIFEKHPTKPYNKPFYRWTITSSGEVEAFIELIYPYCVMKKRQLDVAKEWLSLPRRRGHPMTIEVRVERNILYNEMQTLNQRGVH